MKLFPLALALLLPLLGVAADGPCFSGFAALPEGVAPSPELVNGTYRNLLAKLGGGALEPATIAKMVADSDPFTIPEQASGDLVSLRRRLKEFEGMLQGRGWNTPELRQRLVTQLKAAGEKNEGAREKMDIAVENDAPDHRMGMRRIVAATGPWVLGLPGSDMNRKLGYLLYDRRTHKVTQIPAKLAMYNTPTFTPDGKELLVTDEQSRIMRVPFSNGIADFDHVTPMGTVRRPNERYGAIRFGANPNRFFAGIVVGNPQIQLFDRTNNTRTPVVVKAKVGSTIRDWGLVPGSDHLWVMAGTKQNRKIVTLSVDAAGKTTVLDTREWEGQEHKAAYSPDGKSILVKGEESVRLLQPGQVEVELLSKKVGKPHHSVSDIAMHPTEPTAAILTVEAGEQRRIDWVDVNAGKVVKSFPLAEGRFKELRFSPDGKVLYVKDWTEDWHHVTYRDKLEVAEEPAGARR